MSNTFIRAALEAHLLALDPDIPTAWEGVSYEPEEGTPWRRSTWIPAMTDNPTFGDDHERRLGLIKVNLFWPTGAGTGAITAAAEAILQAFRRGTTFTSPDSKTRVLIHMSPWLDKVTPDGPWVMTTVTVPYSADVFI